MKTSYLFFFLLNLIIPIFFFSFLSPKTLAQTSLCSNSIWGRMIRHTITGEDTLSSIANNYNLLPETLRQVNPNLRSSRLPIGQIMLIPPLNGTIVNPPRGSTWKDLGEAYGVRPDLLFELNGCTPIPQKVFIPGSPNHHNQISQNQNNISFFSHYPLLDNGQIILNYGWQNQENQNMFFHPGVDLRANQGDSVLAVARGIVAFAGVQDIYGNVIILNHGQGLQTRYAHLETINVQMGQELQGGEIIATVGNTGMPDRGEFHLHFEVRLSSHLGWVAQDPLLYFPSMTQ